MKTIIIETTRDRAKAYAAEHLEAPVIRAVGRMVAIQSETLDALGDVAIRDLAAAHKIPLRRVTDAARDAVDEITEAAADEAAVAAKEAAADAARDAVRSVMPWVLGGLGALVVGGVAVAAVRRK